MLEHFIHVQYCYDYLVNQIPMGLLLYSHLPIAIIALIFSTYVLVKSKNLPSVLLFCICFTFTAWCAFDLSAWFSFLGSENTMFVWSLLDFFAVMMFFFSYYFLYTFVTGEDLPLWQKIVGVIVALPSAYVAFSGLNIPLYDLNTCQAVENGSYTIFTYCAQALFILASGVFLVLYYRRNKDRIKRRKAVLTGTGVLVFLIIFFSASFLVSQLADSDAAMYAYNYLIYGLFGMPIFLIYLGYLIVRYHAFNLKIFGAQALILALVALIGSEFAFVNSFTNRILVAITLVFTGWVGLLLIRGVRKEIEQREQIELQEKELEEINSRQEGLIHFISHEVKGFLTKDMGVFASLDEGDFGPLPDAMRPFVHTALEQSRDGARSVMDILQASNQKKGTVSYKKEPFDMLGVAKEWFDKIKPSAEAKQLSFTLSADPGAAPYTVLGDRDQTGDHVLRNLIENAVNYTPHGSVTVSVEKKGDKVIFMVADTGVGITDEDKQRLFTEGGKGKDSLKVNVHSTGYGLFIAKNIVEAEGGTIRAESEGAGKGSRFVVELPSA